MKNLIFMLLLAGSIGGVYAQNAEKKDKFPPCRSIGRHQSGSGRTRNHRMRHIVFRQKD